MPDAEVVRVMREFKRGLLADERQQQIAMSRAWLQVERALDGNMAALAERMSRVAADGGTVTEGMLWQESRYRILQSQLTDELAKYTRYADRTITDRQAQLARLGIDHAARAIEAQGVAAGFARLPVEAVQGMVGLAGDGSPLRSLLTASWPDAAEGLTQELIRGVALGYNPRKVARMMAAGSTRSLDRMMNISRTETMRVYKEASRQSYISSGVVSSYARLATHDRRVCAACLMDEGHVFELDEEMPEHPSGRCALIPYVKGVPNPQWKKGEEWFREQDAATQTSILGKGKYEAWQAGQFDLGELVTVKPNATWGASLGVTPLRELAPSFVRGISRSIDYATARIEDMQTVEDVQKWATARHPNITFDFTDTHINAIKPTTRQFDKLAQQYPEVAARLEYVGTYKGKGAPMRTFNGAIAHATNDGKTIALNPEYYNHPDLLARTKLESLAQNWTDSDGSVESVMTHEFGHQVENWLLATKKGFVPYSRADGFGIVGETVRLFNAKYKPTASLSRYAVTTNSVKTSPYAVSAANRVEGWAEGFAAIQHKPKKEWPIYVTRLDRLLSTVGDTSTWVDYPAPLSIFQSEQREEAIKILDTLRKKVGLD